MATQSLNRSVRDEIHRRVRAAVAADTAADGVGLAAHCLAWAWHGYQVLRDWPGAPRTLIQAGSAAWPRIPPGSDDGVSPTHMAYVWDTDSELARRARLGQFLTVRRPDGSIAASLPEVHVWLGCPDTKELIDFTTGEWPAACRLSLGLDWPGTPPPDYFWGFAARAPEAVRYTPSMEAIDCIASILHLQGRRYP